MNLADPQFARTPKPPYHAVIFTSQRNDVDEGYADVGDRMMELAAEQEGFLGAETARDANGFGFTISYWRDEAAIRAWKANTEHRAAQAKGQARWYDAYAMRIARVERDYGFESSS